MLVTFSSVFFSILTRFLHFQTPSPKRNGRGRSVRSASNYVTSTPNRQSAPNLTATTIDTDLDFETSGILAVAAAGNNISDAVANDLTAEVDLSDENLGVVPLQDSHEDTPMFFTPRSQSRVVRIISKQSNV